MRLLEPYELGLLEIFNNESDGFRIPSYQRPYAWCLDEVIDFWRDIENAYKDKTKLHYFGPMYFINRQQNGKKYTEIIDGQQRLTTTTIFYYAIKRAVHNVAPIKTWTTAMKSVDVLDKVFLTEKMINDEPVMVRKFNSNKIDDFALTLIDEEWETIDFMDEELIQNLQLASPSCERIIEAFCYLTKKMEKMLISNLEIARDNIYAKNTLKEGTLEYVTELQLRGIEDVLAIIIELFKNRFLVMQIYIKKDSPQQIFEMFETINDRGKPLSEVDKVKNFIHKIYYQYQAESGKDVYDNMITIWASVINDIEDRMMYYILDTLNNYNVIGKYVKLNNLFDSFASYINEQDTVTKKYEIIKNFLELLNKNKTIYKQLIFPKSHFINISDYSRAQLQYSHEYEIVRLLKFNFLLNFASDELEKALTITSNFAILYVSVCNYGATDRIEQKIYNVFIKRAGLNNEFDIRKIENYFIAIVHDVKRVDNFNSPEIIESFIKTCSKYRVNNYILCKLNDTLQKEGNSDYFYPLVISNDELNKITAEHIMPQSWHKDNVYISQFEDEKDRRAKNNISGINKQKFEKEYLNTIGNILPIKKSRNSHYGNETCKISKIAKQKTLGVLDIKLTEEHKDQWCIQQVTKRANSIAKLVLENKVLTLKWNEIGEKRW